MGDKDIWSANEKRCVGLIIKAFPNLLETKRLHGFSVLAVLHPAHDWTDPIDISQSNVNLILFPIYNR